MKKVLPNDHEDTILLKGVSKDKVYLAFYRSSGVGMFCSLNYNTDEWCLKFTADLNKPMYNEGTLEQAIHKYLIAGYDVYECNSVKEALSLLVGK